MYDEITLTIKYETSQQGCFILGRLNAIDVNFWHLKDKKIFEIYILADDIDMKEEVEDIEAYLSFWEEDFQYMKNKD